MKPNVTEEKKMEIQYKGSIAETSVMNTNDLEQLRNARCAYVSAVNAHTENGDEANAQFFREGLELIDKKIRAQTGVRKSRSGSVRKAAEIHASQNELGRV